MKVVLASRSSVCTLNPANIQGYVRSICRTCSRLYL